MVRANATGYLKLSITGTAFVENAEYRKG